MSIESKVVESKNNDNIDYPCLMVETDGAIIMMYSESNGFVVNVGDSDYYLGYFSDKWVMNLFTVFDGEVTLSNKKQI